RRERRDQVDLALREGVDVGASEGDDADHLVVVENRNSEHRALAAALEAFLPAVVLVLENVRNVNRPVLERDSADQGAGPDGNGVVDEQLPVAAGPARYERDAVDAAVVDVNLAGFRLAESPGVVDDGLEYRLLIGLGATEYVQHLAGGPLLLAGLVEILPEAFSFLLGTPGL